MLPRERQDVVRTQVEMYRMAPGPPPFIHLGAINFGEIELYSQEYMYFMAKQRVRSRYSG